MKGKPTLEEIVKEDMIQQGFDPKNIEDVNSYWKAKLS